LELYTGKCIGDWTLLSKLGAGVDGQVWSVERNSIRRAMKVCVPSANFYQEYEFLRSVNIHGVIPVYEYNTFEDLVYYIMDLAEGLPFVEYLKQVPSADQYDEAIHLLVGITGIIAQLHTRGLMHLDIKSDNLLVSTEGNITLIDFGKIGFVGDYSVHRKGSHQTMSPEQRSHWYITPKSDVYSLAVTVCQAFMTNVPFANIGQHWKSLIHFNSNIEQCFAGFIQQCLHIVPTERPSMQTFHNAVCAIQTNEYRTEHFPQSETYIGQCPSLQQQNCIVVGPIGSGRRRILYENIRLAYLDGIPAFVTTAEPLHPFSMWKNILASVLNQFSLKQRQNLIQHVENEIASLLPHLFPNQHQAFYEPDLLTLGRAINTVLSRCAPLVVIVQDVDSADIGSVELAKYLWNHPIENVILWGTSMQSVPWAFCIKPPKWTAGLDQQLMRSLLPTNISVRKSTVVKYPLQTSIKAWHLIAKDREEPSMQEGVSTTEMWPLAIVKEPFSLKMSNLVHSNVNHLIEIGVLEYIQHSTTHIRFTFLPFRWMVQQSLILKRHYKKNHLKLVDSWEMTGDVDRRHHQLYHLFYADELAPTHIARALWLAIRDLNTLKVQRWWWLCRLYGIKDSNTAYRLATVMLAATTQEDAKDPLTELAKNNLRSDERYVLKYLQFKQLLRQKLYDQAIELAESLLGYTNPPISKIQLSIYVDLATMYLHNDDTENTLRLCKHALSLPMIEHHPRVAIQIYHLLSLGFIARSQLIEGLQMCTQGLHLPETLLEQRIRLRFNQGWIQYQRGKRVESRHIWNTVRQECTQIDNHPIQLRSLIESIRLEIESGRAQYQQHRVNACLSAHPHINRQTTTNDSTGNVQALCWNLATQMASSRWAKKGFEVSSTPLNDRAKLALARWYWLIGDLSKGWELLESQHHNYDGFHIQVEKVRFGLLLGHFTWALQQAQYLQQHPLLTQFVDLHLLLILCIECLKFDQPATLLTEELNHEWVEVYLGGLHLLALRKRLRSENNYDTLKILKKRAQALNHKLYLALSEPTLYT